MEIFVCEFMNICEPLFDCMYERNKFQCNDISDVRMFTFNSLPSFDWRTSLEAMNLSYHEWGW